MISFVVYGKAESAGSKRAFALRKGGGLVLRPSGHPVISVTDDNPKSRAWKQEVAAAARAVYAGPVIEGAVFVEMAFYRMRPKAHFRKNGILSARGAETPYPIGKPDALKLARGVEDALTSIIWRDDAQIVKETLWKRWGEPQRVEVIVSLDSLEGENAAFIGGEM